MRFVTTFLTVIWAAFPAQSFDAMARYEIIKSGLSGFMITDDGDVGFSFDVDLIRNGLN